MLVRGRRQNVLGQLSEFRPLRFHSLPPSLLADHAKNKILDLWIQKAMVQTYLIFPYKYAIILLSCSCAVNLPVWKIVSYYQGRGCLSSVGFRSICHTCHCVCVSSHYSYVLFELHSCKTRLTPQHNILFLLELEKLTWDWVLLFFNGDMVSICSYFILIWNLHYLP